MSMWLVDFPFCLFDLVFIICKFSQEPLCILYNYPDQLMIDHHTFSDHTSPKKQPATKAVLATSASHSSRGHMKTISPISWITWDLYGLHLGTALAQLGTRWAQLGDELGTSRAFIADYFKTSLGLLWDHLKRLL